MTDVHESVAIGPASRARIARCLFVVFLVGLVTPVGIATAETPARSDGGASNASVSFDYYGDALAHEGDVLFVWRRESLDVRVQTGPDAAGDRVCLYRNGHSEPRRLGCRPLDRSGSGGTVAFDDAGFDADGPTVYRIEARLLDDDRVVASERSRRIVQITNWSALNGSQFADYISDTDLLNETGPIENDAGRGGGNGSADDRDIIGGRKASGAELVVPGVTTVSVGTFGPVVLLGCGGLLALVGLLYVQRRRGSGTGPGGEIVVQAADEPRTDTQRVVHLLAENDGQLKQSEIVERTDWSKAKVSRLLSKMADRGRVEKRQDGRQNIIVLRHGE